jgi:TrmH family RNA methyltransferase
MIPLHKLAKLPRSQKLRKAASLIRNAEHRLVVTGQLSSEEAEYFCRIAEFLAEDEKFHPNVVEAMKKSQIVFSSSALESDKGEIRRALNTIYHLLLTETGRNQADWDFIEASGALDQSKRHPFHGMQVYFEDIRSPFNVGSMFRAAESFGVDKIWLSPLCADPRHKRALRTAMGCVDLLPWQQLQHDPFADKEAPPAEFAEFIEGPFFALETGGTPLADFPFPKKGILIAGSEELGVSPPALAAADASLGRVSIPVRGAKGSLNVSVAFGIVMQAWAAKLSSFCSG